MKQFLKPGVVAILLSSIALPVMADTKDEIIARLEAAGYTKIEIKKTLLGRTKIEAKKPGWEYEVVLNNAGVVLREEEERQDEENDDDDDNDGDDDDDDGDDDDGDDD